MMGHEELGSSSGDLLRGSEEENENMGVLPNSCCRRKLLVPGDLTTYARRV